MRFVVVFACLLAYASAQLNSGQYVADRDRYKYNRYQPNQYNPFNQYNNNYNYQNRNQNRFQNYNNYKPYVSSTPFPRPAVTVTPAPIVVPKLTVAPAPVVVPVVTPAPVVPVVPVISAAKSSIDARSAETVKYGNEISPDGAYNYFFETNNGIAAQAQGTPRNFGGNPPVVPDVAQGSFSWYSPEGNLVAINWVADENGYQASGDAIPQPPPLPAQIARALEYVARNAPVVKSA